MSAALTLRVRIALSFGAILLLVFALGGWLTWSIDGDVEAFQHYRAVARVSAGLAEVRAEFFGARLASESHLLTGDPDQLTLGHERLAAALRVQQQTLSIANELELQQAVQPYEAEIARYRDLLVAKLALQPLSSGYRGLLAVGREVTGRLAKDDAQLQGMRNREGPLIDADMRSSSSRAKMMTGIALIIGCLIAVVLGRALAREITGLTSAMTGLAAGDLGTHLPNNTRRDEIGAMTAALQVFKDNLIRTRALEEETAQARLAAEEQRRAGSRQMAEGFERTVGSIIATVASAATELQVTARTMVGTASQTAQQSVTVAAASEEAASNVNTVAAAAEELSSSVQEISRQVDGSASLAQAAVTEAGQTAALVQALSASVTKIGDVVSMITTIAEQTNLLALNATIEAARAGEAGRGFAVVAAEVKELASQTAKATDEISGQIAQIQGSTGQAVTAIGAITARIEEISAVATSIAAAVEQQGAATQEIVRNVSQAAHGTSEVTSNMTGVASAVEETGAAASQVLGAASELSRQSEHLRSEVARFLDTVHAA